MRYRNMKKEKFRRFGSFYGYLISIPEDSKVFKLILIAKASKCSKGTISIRRDVLYPAKYIHHIPILLALRHPDSLKIRYYLFDAEWILNGNYNTRRIPLELSEEWTFNDKIQIKLEELEKRKKIAIEQYVREKEAEKARKLQKSKKGQIKLTEFIPTIHR